MDVIEELDGAETPPLSRRTIAGSYVLLAFVQVINAGSALLGKRIVSHGMDPIVFSFYRDVGASPLMLLLAAGSGWRVPAGFAEIAMFAFLGLSGVVGAQLLFFVGLSLLPPSIVSIFALFQPVLVPFVAAAFGLDRLCLSWRVTLLRLGGLLLCIVGTAVEILASDSESGGANSGRIVFLGVLVMLLQSLAGACYQVTNKNLLQKGWPPAAVVAWGYTFGVVELACFLPLAGSWEFSNTAVVTLIYSVLLQSVFNFIAMAVANKYVGPTAVAVFFPLMPILVAVGQPLVGEGSFHLVESLTMVVVFGGLACFIAGQSLMAREDAAAGRTRTYSRERCGSWP